MGNEYAKRLESLLTHAKPELVKTHRLEFKNCFGAVAGYVNGCIFISCGKFGVGLRLHANVLQRLFKAADVKSLRYFPKGHVKKEYAVLPERILGDEKQLEELIGKSLEYVQSIS